MKKTVLAAVLTFATAFGVVAYARFASADAGVTVIPAMVDAGAGSDVAPPPAAAAPSDALHNPATSPVAAWDDEKAARKTSWPLAVWAALAMLGKALAYGRDKLKGLPAIGWIANRLSVGKTAMIVAGIGAVGAAGYDILASGGSLVAALTASAVAVAGAMHSTTQGAA